jgi:hypothetical protein
MPIDGIGKSTLIVLESIADGKVVDDDDGWVGELGNLRTKIG